MTERFTSLMGRSCARHLSPFLRTCSTVLLLVLIVSGSAAADDVITQWNEFLLTLNSTVIPPATAVLRPPNAASLDMAYVHIAMYDAVTAIEGGYRPFAVSLSRVLPGASPAAAAVAAAYAVLKNKVYTPAAFPSIQARMDAEYALLLAQIPGGQSKTDGIAIGQTVAAAFINLRQNDEQSCLDSVFQSQVNRLAICRIVAQLHAAENWLLPQTHHAGRHTNSSASFRRSEFGVVGIRNGQVIEHGSAGPVVCNRRNRQNL